MPAESRTESPGRAAPPRVMHEIRLVGRGGGGVVTAAELIGRAALREGRHAQAVPAFGPERRGALAMGTVRIGEERILLRCAAMRPHYLVVFDPTIWHVANVVLGLDEGGVMVFNSSATPDVVEDELRAGRYGYRLAADECEVLTVDATSIALEHLGKPITNTAMLGALAAGTGLLGMPSIEAVLEERFGADAGRNIAAARAAAERVVGRGG